MKWLKESPNTPVPVPVQILEWLKCNLIMQSTSISSMSNFTAKSPFCNPKIVEDENFKNNIQLKMLQLGWWHYNQ